MGTMTGNQIGLAGEFRVMCELLMRGHNPAKSYLEQGPDIILENGLRIEIKSAHRVKTGGARFYYFTLNGSGPRKRQDLSGCDFMIFWCIDDDCFFIVPMADVGTSACFTDVSTGARHRYATYLNKWDLLEVTNGN